MDGADVTDKVSVAISLEIVQEPDVGGHLPPLGDAVRLLDVNNVEEAALEKQGWGEDRTLAECILEVVAERLDGP